MSIKYSSTVFTISMFLLLLASSTLQAKQFNVLLFTKTMEWHHKSKPAGVMAIQALAKKHDFSIT